MKKTKKFGLVRIYSLLKSGLSPAQISKEYNIPKQTIAYNVDKLKQQGCIEKVGYGVWKCLRSPKEVRTLTSRHLGKSTQKIRTSLKKKEIRGHAFIWKIEFERPYEWERIINNYSKNKLKFQLMRHNNIYRTIFNNRKIWLGKKGLTIYEPLDFLGKSSFEVKGKAVFEMDLLIKHFLKELNIKFYPYRFTTSREHYGIIKNELARQYNDRKEKMNIRSEDGNLWMWIDDSLSLGELENSEPTVNRQVQNYWNNHKKHNFQVDADFILNTMDGIQQNQLIFDRNMVSHLKVIRDLGTGVQSLIEAVKNIHKVLEKTNNKQP